ncbi:ndufs4 NADH dehydrogenase Fe-S protein subunit [Pleosporales sp. CAS-2024a]
MSALPRSLAAQLRPWALALRPSGARALAPQCRRAYSTMEPTPHQHRTTSDDAPAVRLTSDSTQIREEGAAEGMRHQPDYNVAVDYRTSHVSPQRFPKRVMDGSEPGESVAAAVLSGAPVDLQARTVRIYKPTKTATQSGNWNSSHWLMDWDVLPKGHRWENPLMGWASSADFMNGHRIQFKSKEDAINFANKQGYEYFVQEPNTRKFKPKAYANLFTHVPGKLKVVLTK